MYLPGLTLYLFAAAATVCAKLQKFNLDITQGTVNFDGKSLLQIFIVDLCPRMMVGTARQGFLINGQSPGECSSFLYPVRKSAVDLNIDNLGPALTVDQNDDVEVFVRNNSPHEITIHVGGSAIVRERTYWNRGY